MNNKFLSIIFLCSVSCAIQCNDFLDGLRVLFGRAENTQGNPVVGKEYFCSKLYQDLAGIPENDRHEIVRAVAKEMASFSEPYVDLDLANQYARSAILDRVKQQAELYAKELYRDNRHAIHNAVESQEGNVVARFGIMTNINGLALAQFFGAPLREAMRSAATNPRCNSTSYSTPAPHHDFYSYNGQSKLYNTPAPTYNQPRQGAAPSGFQVAHKVPAMTDSEQGFFLEKAIGEYLKVLEKGKTDKALLIRYKQHCYTQAAQHQNSSFDDLKKCCKNQILTVFIELLYVCKEELKQNITKEKQSLETAAKDITDHMRTNISTADAKPLDTRNIAPYCTKERMKETILAQMGRILSCPICFEQYRDQFRGGQGGVRVLVPCGSSVPHYVCSGTHCVKAISNKCPECRAPFPQSSLDNNVLFAQHIVP